LPHFAQAEPVGVPHLSQNLVPADSIWLHFAQAEPVGAPHLSQNLAPATSLLWHFAQKLTLTVGLLIYIDYILKKQNLQHFRVSSDFILFGGTVVIAPFAAARAKNRG
jgi:hypothetical protein